MTTRRKKTLGQRLAAFVRTKRKAIAAGVSQLVTTGIAWVGLHTGLDIDAQTAAYLAGTVGALVSAFVVHEVTNELA
jgi:hypothetical protein